MKLKSPLILDGATGTELQKKGLPMGQSTEKWVLDHPSSIKEIQADYLMAGSDLIYAPTFGANRIKMEENGFGDDVKDYNLRLAALSKQTIDECGCGGKAYVCGDMAPLGKFLPPVGDMPFEEMYQVYAEQAQALEQAGVDCFVIETTMSLPEARAALLAVKSLSDKPVFVTFTVNEKGKTLTGTDATAALLVMQSMGASAFGLNCSTGPDQMLEQIKRLAAYNRIPLIAKPNAGLPEIIDGLATYHCPPQEFASYVPDFAANGVRIFGGCCGTRADHIKALRQAVDALPKETWESDEQAQDSDIILIATEKQVFQIPKDFAIAEEDILSCQDPDDFEDDLYDEEDKDCPVTAVEITSQEEALIFAQAQYAIAKPLALFCEDAELLEKVLRAYQGQALYCGSLPAEKLKELKAKYGLLTK